MSAAMNVYGASNILSIAIEKKSMLLKSMSYVPSASPALEVATVCGLIASICGILYAGSQDAALQDQINKPENAPRLIELINKQNHFKVVSVISHLFVLAVKTIDFSINISSGAFIFDVAIILLQTALITAKLFQIKNNNQIIENLQTTNCKTKPRVA